MSDSTNVKINASLNGYAAHPKGRGPSPGLVVMMEAYGITGHIQGVCARLAKSGFLAVAPDIFHGEVISYTDTNKVMAKIPTLNDEQILREIGETLDWLGLQKNVDPHRLGIIGFCMGGRHAFYANCRYPDKLKAAVGFYGGGIAPEGTTDRFGRTPPIGEAAKMQAPMFLGYGADDQSIPPSEHARIVEKLSTLKKRFTLAVYPDAGHAFLCEERSNYAPAVATRAWPEALEFLRNEMMS
ncbi:MAG: dienelactone hydrolase family protein [Gammaproteobacteria bacterium]|nr:dienelactone hydrolase family protein [Gammaproteobacteria bacterium]MDE1887028.1 dienelactone hydrolase family protein [Gammaproteobacteria bacterium]MDE2022973.1 dienelactone hydrolase family protein [Gammaproteobacteria bacterium]MDE2272698.1 dienelactone hydrolase family protein [Gammaproteobacteria bacterium]